MKKQSVREFIREHREEIDTAIRRVCSNCRIDDNERRLWLLNDEGLYLWAKSHNVNI